MNQTRRRKTNHIERNLYLYVYFLNSQYWLLYRSTGWSMEVVPRVRCFGRDGCSCRLHSTGRRANWYTFSHSPNNAFTRHVRCFAHLPRHDPRFLTSSITDRGINEPSESLMMSWSSAAATAWSRVLSKRTLLAENGGEREIHLEATGLHGSNPMKSITPPLDKASRNLEVICLTCSSLQHWSSTDASAPNLWWISSWLAPGAFSYMETWTSIGWREIIVCFWRTLFNLFSSCEGPLLAWPIYSESSAKWRWSSLQSLFLPPAVDGINSFVFHVKLVTLFFSFLW